MELVGLHLLLTYQCTFECDHCFVWGSPFQSGVMTLDEIFTILYQAKQLGTIEWIYFEGGEPTLYYPVLLKAVQQAKAMGFQVGIVSNSYWATSVEDAVEWLQPLVEAGLDVIELSSDLFHGESMETPESRHGLAAAKQLGLTTASSISIDPPTGYRDPGEAKPGEPLTGGGVMYRGRAAERLIEGLPRQPWLSFSSCPYEDLANPGRIHLDPLGNLHLCQGVVLGNLFQKPLTQLVARYEPANHPIVGPLLAGGPAELARRYHLEPQPGYVDACHMCYTTRQALRPRFPEQLGPDQMYGIF